MIPQVHERRQHVVAHIGGERRRGVPGGHGRRLRTRQPILQFQDDALRRFFADARDCGQPPDVTSLDRANQFERLDPRQHRERDLRSNAADTDQPLEEFLLERRGEAVERERVLPYVRVRPERDVRAGVAEHVEGREWDEDVVADAVDVDDHAVGMFLEDAPAKLRDHGR